MKRHGVNPRRAGSQHNDAVSHKTVNAMLSMMVSLTQSFSMLVAISGLFGFLLSVDFIVIQSSS